MGPWAPVGPRYHNPGGFALLTFGTYNQWWQDGIVPSQEQRLRELRAILEKCLSSDASLVTQMQMAEAGSKSLHARMAGNSGKTIDSEMFLQLFHDADKIRILMDNVARECVWLEAMNRDTVVK